MSTDLKSQIANAIGAPAEQKAADPAPAAAPQIDYDKLAAALAPHVAKMVPAAAPAADPLADALKSLAGQGGPAPIRTPGAAAAVPVDPSNIPLSQMSLSDFERMKADGTAMKWMESQARGEASHPFAGKRRRMPK